jgi:glycogen operon protein
MQFYFAADFTEAEILEILRYWVVNFHVDAFHLMGMNIPMSLVASDPMLAGTKILSDHLESINFDIIRKPGDRRVIGYYSDDF